ncbi:MAG: hypothetical protein RR107_05910 [Clostridia bacterium]
MFASIKRIIEMNKVTGKITSECDENGMLTINLTVQDDENFLSPFSYGAEPTLSSDVAEFLDKSLKPSQYKDDIHLKIHSDVIDENEKLRYEKAIRNHYSESYVAERQKMRRDFIISMYMLLVGVVFLAAIVILNAYQISGIAAEIVDIIAWVFLWEAADIFFLQRKVSAWHQHRNISFFKAEITFIPLI